MRRYVTMAQRRIGQSSVQTLGVKGRTPVKLTHSCSISWCYKGSSYPAPPPTLTKVLSNQAIPFLDHTSRFWWNFLHPVSRQQGHKQGLALSIHYWVVWAVHKLMPDMSAPAFMRVFKRLAWRRGIPQRISSDNCQRLKCADKMLQSMLKQQDVTHYLVNNNINL